MICFLAMRFSQQRRRFFENPSPQKLPIRERKLRNDPVGLLPAPFGSKKYAQSRSDRLRMSAWTKGLRIYED